MLAGKIEDIDVVGLDGRRLLRIPERQQRLKAVGLTWSVIGESRAQQPRRGDNVVFGIAKADRGRLPNHSD